MLRIRPLNPGDVPAVLALVQDVLAEHGFSANVGGVREDISAADRYERNGAGFWVAELPSPEDGIVGTVAVRPKDGRTCELKRLYVAASARGRGVGRALYAHAEAFARAAGYDRIWLDSSRRFRSARKLYDHHGFVLLEERDNDWEDNVYEKRLTSAPPDGKKEAAMMIKIGDRIPDATLMESTGFGEACPLPPEKVSVAEACKGKRIVVFGLPGAYTPTCSSKHVPGYLARIDELRAKKVDEVWCVSVNDGYVMAAWGQDQKATGKIRMLGDGSAELARKLGLDVDMGPKGMGIRMKRFSMLLDDGVVQQLNVEEPGKFERSNVETMLAQLG
ncbi:MAG TPA: GNAT family N-acetyltransferase [Polyangiaceae bacterium]|nr:GNAT family N-acetyltransferase [Polyangiaceae bacterium]